MYKNLNWIIFILISKFDEALTLSSRPSLRSDIPRLLIHKDSAPVRFPNIQIYLTFPSVYTSYVLINVFLSPTYFYRFENKPEYAEKRKVDIVTVMIGGDDKLRDLV